MSEVGKVQAEINYETIANIHVSYDAWTRVVPAEVEKSSQNCLKGVCGGKPCR